MPTSTVASVDTSTTDSLVDPLAGVDHIIVIDNGAHNIRIASIPYPFHSSTHSSCYTPSSSTSTSVIDPTLLAQEIAIDVFPNAIARTRTPHTIPPSPSPTAPAPGSKTSFFVSSHIHDLLDDYAALHLRLPHQSGVVVDWAAQKTIWDHVLTNHLAKLPGGVGGKKAKLLANKAVVITETYCNLEPAQQAIDLLLFEHYGAAAVWRTTSAILVGLGTDVFRSDLPLPPAQTPDVDSKERAAKAADDIKTEEAPASPAKRLRAPRASTNSTSTIPESSTPSTPKLLSIPRPQCMLVLDLSYSACHAIPLISGTPIYPAIRRLELGAKMLINLLKETLSFQQLDMMDESWLISHIFSRTSFVAADVGRRVYGSDEKIKGELEKIREKEAVDWSYEDLLLLEKFEKKKKGREGDKGVGVTWSLPDYGGESSPKGGREGRDRVRYGYIVSGPNPPPFRPQNTSNESDHPRKHLKSHSLFEWESSFIASSSTSTSSRAPSGPSYDTNEDEEEKEDIQTLHLSNERFSTLENLYNPSALGLDQKPLPELIQGSLTTVASTYSKTAADCMWGNIVLTGGLANAVGMRRRLENDLRPIAPVDVEVRIWPDAERGEDLSLGAIQAGVGVAVEVAAREGLKRREREVLNEGDAVGKGGGRGGKKKMKGRASRGLGDVEKGEEEARDTVGKWLTYAQWMNPASGGTSDGDLVRAANSVFYPALPETSSKSTA